MVRYGVFCQRRNRWSGPYRGSLCQTEAGCRGLVKRAQRVAKKKVRVLKVVVED
jgi:hypothetical protein